jgi:hypothetical protein
MVPNQDYRSGGVMSTLRVGLLVVAVVIGGLIIANGFPSGGNPTPVGHTTTSPSPSPSSSSTPPPHKGLVCGSPQGVLIAVENAAGVPVLAAPTAVKLKAAGYAFASPTDVSDATYVSNTTTVFYRLPANKHAAACLKKNFFPAATLKPMSAGGTSAHPAFSASAVVAVFLGKDYAASHPSP